jgi:hypothetical protein
MDKKAVGKQNAESTGKKQTMSRAFRVHNTRLTHRKRGSSPPLLDNNLPFR